MSDTEEKIGTVYCDGCTKASGSDMPIYHLPPVCNSGDQRAGKRASVSVQGKLCCPRCKEGTTFLISLKDGPGLWITCGACGWATHSGIISLAVPAPVSALREAAIAYKKAVEEYIDNMPDGEQAFDEASEALAAALKETE